MIRFLVCQIRRGRQFILISWTSWFPLIPTIEDQVMFDPEQLDGQFKTPSGKIEIISKKLGDAGLPSLLEYQSPAKPPRGMFRLIPGRTAVHSHGHTINNPLLNELLSQNSLWINDKSAAKLGITHGDLVDVVSEDESYSRTVHANVVDYLHPEAVFTLHGFGKEIPLQTRSFHLGVSDQKLMRNKLADWDKAGGAISLCETFVVVRRSVKNPKRRVEL